MLTSGGVQSILLLFPCCACGATKSTRQNRFHLIRCGTVSSAPTTFFLKPGLIMIRFVVHERLDRHHHRLRHTQKRAHVSCCVHFGELHKLCRARKGHDLTVLHAAPLLSTLSPPCAKNTQANFPVGVQIWIEARLPAVGGQKLDVGRHRGVVLGKLKSRRQEIAIHQALCQCTTDCRQTRQKDCMSRKGASTCMRNVKKPKAYGDRAGPITRLSHLSRSSSSTGRDQMPVQGRKQSRRKVMPAARHRIQASRAHRLRRDAPNSLRSQLMRETCRAACGAGRRRAHRRLASSCCRSSLQPAAQWPRHRTPASWTMPPRHCPRTWPRDFLWQESPPRPLRRAL